MQSTINRIPVHTINCQSVSELKKRVAELRTQMAKLPPLPSGKKRSFACSGLVITITEPVWNELASLQVRKEVTQHLIAEIESQPATPATAPTTERPVPSMSWSREQLQVACLEAGIRYKSKDTKAQLLALLA